MKIVQINGLKRSGKNHLGEILKNKLQEEGLVVQLMAFADPIKEILATALNISVAELDKRKNDMTAIADTTYREVLQRFGTEAMQSTFGSDVWTDLLVRNINKSTDVVIVTDLRFDHEVLYGAILVNIFNADLVSADSHASEAILNDVDFHWTIDNTGRGDLTFSADSIIDSLFLTE